MIECPGCGERLNRVAITKLVYVYTDNDSGYLDEVPWHRLCYARQLPEVRALAASTQELRAAILAIIDAWDDYEMLPALDCYLYDDAMAHSETALSPFEEAP
jgi:hypothetical protein